MVYKIFDWAGNKPFGEKRFDTFEDAWEYLYEWLSENRPEEEFEDECGEYYVDKVMTGDGDVE